MDAEIFFHLTVKRFQALCVGVRHVGLGLRAKAISKRVAGQFGATCLFGGTLNYLKKTLHKALYWGQVCFKKVSMESASSGEFEAVLCGRGRISLQGIPPHNAMKCCISSFPRGRFTKTTLNSSLSLRR